MRNRSSLVMAALALCLMVVFSAGCITTDKSKEHRQLEGAQRAQAEEWLHSANLLNTVGDHSFALDYYNKVIKYYPGTKYAAEAQKKVAVLNK